jgi:hypothetical protein
MTFYYLRKSTIYPGTHILECVREDRYASHIDFCLWLTDIAIRQYPNRFIEIPESCVRRLYGRRSVMISPECTRAKSTGYRLYWPHYLPWPEELKGVFK